MPPSNEGCRVASPKISVIIPVHNESANIDPLCDALVPVLNRITSIWEVVFVDDGSEDDTFARIRTRSQAEPRIGAVAFSRNFGKEIAIAAGLDHARGEAVVIMDADLQHPPEMIETFVERWQEGYLMVYGQRTDRSDETRIKRGFAHLFYRMFSTFGEVDLPEGAGDFRLIDRKGVEVLRMMGEKARFSKGLYAWIGFKHIGVPFVVQDRKYGQSSWSFRRLFRFAFDGIASFSSVPLRVWTYLGTLISICSIVTAVYFAIRTMIYGTDLPGFPSLIVSVMFFSGIQLMSLGVIGEYIGRIFSEVKRRPLYVVSERIGGAAEVSKSLVNDSYPLRRS
jgi:glycosyltransferase involved in cell wall biosynthesis